MSSQLKCISTQILRAFFHAVYTFLWDVIWIADITTYLLLAIKTGDEPLKQDYCSVKCLYITNQYSKLYPKV